MVQEVKEQLLKISFEKLSCYRSLIIYRLQLINTCVDKFTLPCLMSRNVIIDQEFDVSLDEIPTFVDSWVKNMYIE